MKTKSNQFLPLIFAAVTLIVYLFLPVFNGGELLGGDNTGWSYIQSIPNDLESLQYLDGTLSIMAVLSIVFSLLPTVGAIVSVCGGLAGSSKTVKSGSGIGVAGLIGVFFLPIVTAILLAADLGISLDIAEAFGAAIEAFGIGFWGALVGFILTSVFSKA